MAKPTYVWTGSEWAEVGPGPVVPTTKYQATAPESPSTGDIWVDSSSYAPGVEARDINVGHQILTTAERDQLTGVAAGTMIYNSTNSRLEVYSGSVWDPRPFLQPNTGSGTRNTQIDITGSNTVTVLSASIQPQVATSKVLISISGHAYITTGGDASFGDKILRGASQIFQRTEFIYSSSTYAHFESWGLSWIDSPNTTSSVTYNYQIIGSNRGACGFARGGGTTGCAIQLLEIIN